MIYIVRRKIACSVDLMSKLDISFEKMAGSRVLGTGAVKCVPYGRGKNQFSRNLTVLESYIIAFRV